MTSSSPAVTVLMSAMTERSEGLILTCALFVTEDEARVVSSESRLVDNNNRM